MALFNVYLGEIGSSGLSDSEKKDCQARLQTWFGKLVDEGDSVSISWVSSVPASIQDHELLVYFVRSSGSSILKFMPGVSGSGTDDGFTAFGGNLTGSEVYVSSSRRGLAEMAFHELMHNKLHLDNPGLHQKDGLATLPVPVGGQPSAANIKEMKAALNNKQKQWTGGWLAASDPSNGYL